MSDINILFMEAYNILERDYDDQMISFMESGDLKKKSIFNRIIDKIREIIEAFKKKINDFFNNKNSREKEKKIEEALKKNKKFADKKMKVKDYKKIMDLEDNTIKEIKKCKTSKEVKNVMENHNKKRSKLLITIPILTISAFGFYKLYKSMKPKLEKKIDEEEKKVKVIINESEKSYEDLEKELQQIEIDNKRKQEERKNELNKKMQESRETLKAQQDGYLKIFNEKLNILNKIMTEYGLSQFEESDFGDSYNDLNKLNEFMRADKVSKDDKDKFEDAYISAKGKYAGYQASKKSMLLDI